MARTEVRGGQILDASVSLTADVTGILPVANGGTGAATQNANNVLLGNGTGALQNVAPSTNNNVLTSNGTTWASVASGGRLPGEITAYSGRSAVSGWLWCDGAAQTRATYQTLFDTICPSVGTVTTTIATPGVFTLSGHLFVTGDAIYLTTTGALPTGLTANTLYYVKYLTTTTFNLSTSRANAFIGTVIATSGSQSGVHTLRACPYGLGNGSTTFNVPDLRGRIPVGSDGIGAVTNNPAGRVNLGQAGGVYGQLGATGGAEGQVITVDQLAAHTHTYANTRGAMGYVGGSNQSIDPSLGAAGNNTGSTGGDSPHNNMPPSQMVNYIIKT